jgi:hypothetical protein
MEARFEVGHTRDADWGQTRCSCVARPRHRVHRAPYPAQKTLAVLCSLKLEEIAADEGMPFNKTQYLLEMTMVVLAVALQWVKLFTRARVSAAGLASPVAYWCLFLLSPQEWLQAGRARAQGHAAER